jgi:hypothetical protein
MHAMDASSLLRFFASSLLRFFASSLPHIAYTANLLFKRSICGTRFVVPVSLDE